MTELARDDRATSLRLFFALWPDPATRDALMRLPVPSGRRRTPVAQLHLTLAFLGNQPATLVPTLAALLDELPFVPLPLRIDRLGAFRRSRILWAGMDCPPALPELHRVLLERLTQVGVAMAPPSPFRPHVTLMRNAPLQPPPATSFEPIDWLACEIALVASETAPDGASYRVLAMRRSVDAGTG